MAAGPSSRSTFFFSDVQFIASTVKSWHDRAPSKVLEGPVRLFDNSPTYSSNRILTYFPF